MSRSQQLIEVLTEVIVNDAKSPLPVIDYFLNHDLRGGWEGWLQVAYARAVLGSQLRVGDFNREVVFPETNQYCDLCFTSEMGAPMWVELKTQRRASYLNTVPDFEDDILKLRSLSEEFRATNVLVALAVLKLHPGDGDRLNALRAMPGGTITYLLFTGDAAAPWLNVTEDIASTTTNGEHELLLATFRLS